MIEYSKINCGSQPVYIHYTVHDGKYTDSDSDSEIIYSDKDYIEYNIIKKNVLMCLGDFC